MKNTITRVKNRYFNIFNDFCTYWHSLSEQIVEWEPFSYYEILVTSENGITWIYSYSEKTITRVYRKDNHDFTEEEWRHNFAVVLKRKLIAANMTSIELSNRTGISTIMISRYLNGKVSPSAYNITRIAEAIGCTTSSLIDNF